MPRHSSHGGGGSNKAAAAAAATAAGSPASSSLTGGGGALTSATTTISTFLPPALHQIIAPSSAPQPHPRRRLPKGIPILETVDSSTLPVCPPTPPSQPSKLRSGISDLSAKVSGPGLPVVRAGAIFLSTLSASVALSASLQPPSNPSSAPPSPCLLPVRRQSAQLAPFSASSSSSDVQSLHTSRSSSIDVSSMSSEASGAVAAAPTTLPSLDFVPASSDDERTDGLKLVADSIAQRRQQASWAIMTHPFFLGLLGLAFSGVYSYMYKVPGDLGLVFTTCVGVLMAGLVSIRAAVRPIIDFAETINYKWLDEKEGSEVVVARWGDGTTRKVIGAVVFNVEKGIKGSNGKKAGKVAYVRAWTTRQRERGRGVGKGLIEETVKLAKARGADTVKWQEDNIYDKRLVPKLVNSGFVQELKRVRQKFDEYISESSGR